MKKYIVNLNILLFVFLIFFSAQFSLAQNSNIDETLIDKELEECATKNYMTNGMNLCIKNSTQKWNIIINQYLSKIKNNLPSSEIKYLDKAQKSWLNYYKKESLFIDKLIEKEKGQIYSTIALNKLYQLTKQRALTLKNYYLELTKNN